MAQSTSGAVSGNTAGFYITSTLPIYYVGATPYLQFSFTFSASSDYSSNSRVWMGLVGSSCSLATMTASANPACSYAAIRWDTSVPDSTWLCVVNNGGTQQTSPIGSLTPSTSFHKASILLSSSSAVCSIDGTTSSPITTSIPASTVAMYTMITNTTLTTSATHLRVGEIQGYHQNRSY